MGWFLVSAAAMIVTAAIHSYAGEKRLVGPALAERNGIFAAPHSRKLMRVAWHLTSFYMALCAIVMLWSNVDPRLKAVVSAFWMLQGLFSLISSRGRHVGWPSLCLAGVAGLVGSMA